MSLTLEQKNTYQIEIVSSSSHFILTRLKPIFAAAKT